MSKSKKPSPRAADAALPQATCSAVENHEAPLLREIRDLKIRMAVSRENIAACASAISALDRVTPRPLTPEDQARAVLEYLSGQDAQPNAELSHPAPEPSTNETDV
jgi:hypothetical protein